MRGETKTDGRDQGRFVRCQNGGHRPCFTDRLAGDAAVSDRDIAAQDRAK